MANTWKFYGEGLKNLASGNIVIGTDTFKMALFTSSKTINNDTDSTYSTTNEVANGNGYTTGGAACTISLNVDTTNNKLEIRFTDPVSWTTATITARHAIVYKVGASPYVLAYMTFGDASPADVSSTNGTFSIDETDANGTALTISY